MSLSPGVPSAAPGSPGRLWAAVSWRPQGPAGPPGAISRRPPTGQSPSREGPIVPLRWVPPAQAARRTHLARAAATSPARPQRPCLAGPGAQEMLPSGFPPPSAPPQALTSWQICWADLLPGDCPRDISGVRASPQEHGPSLHIKPRQAHVGRGCPGRLESRLSRPHVPTCWTQMTRTERRVLSQETKSEASSRGRSAPGTPGTPMDSGSQGHRATGHRATGHRATCLRLWRCTRGSRDSNRPRTLHPLPSSQMPGLETGNGQRRTPAQC